MFYPFMAMQKVFACQLQGYQVVLSSVAGFPITLGNAKIQSITDESVGRCLSAYYEENAASPAEQANSQSLAGTAQTVARQIVHAQSMYLEVLKHTIDAFFAWMIGVISGVQDVVQTVDSGSCKMPDFYMQDVFKCACGDTPYKIPLDKAQNSALWCTGTLRMLVQGSDTTTVIYNPYSYHDIQTLLLGGQEQQQQQMGLIAYLKCISTNERPDYSAADTGSDNQQEGCDSLLPKIPDFEAQGVSGIAVLSRYFESLSSCSAAILASRSM